MKKYIIFILSYLFFVQSSCAEDVIVGAERYDLYKDLLKDKKIGLLVNQTSLVNEIHLVDFLLDNKLDVVRIFAPEHGFRGESAPGEQVNDSIDLKTGIKVTSLYGKNKKPSDEMLNGIDVIVFDIQDVGCRFYTYISTMHYMMEACAKNQIEMIIMDRPNPNGDYVAGPVLKPQFKSFVGMHQIPVVHGLTVGELASMINGEGWLENEGKCTLTVIPIANWDHRMIYELPIKPSPNLPNYQSVRLYPSLCFFEATNVSIGRGTSFPFQVIGYPDQNMGKFSFRPEEITRVALNPKQKGKLCYGVDLRKESIDFNIVSYFYQWYHKFEKESDFLQSERWLNLLVGDDCLIRQLREGKSLDEIVASWQNELEEYNSLRKKYLLYPDFE